MRGDPPTILQALLMNGVVLIGFVAVAVAQVRRARNPNTVPRDELDALTIRLPKNPTRREKFGFLIVLAVGLAAPWLTRYFAL